MLCADDDHTRIILLGGYLGTADIVDHLTTRSGVAAEAIHTPARASGSRPRAETRAADGVRPGIAHAPRHVVAVFEPGFDLEPVAQRIAPGEHVQHGHQKAVAPPLPSVHGLVRAAPGRSRGRRR